MTNFEYTFLALTAGIAWFCLWMVYKLSGQVEFLFNRVLEIERARLKELLSRDAGTAAEAQ